MIGQLIQQAGAHNVSHTLGSIITYVLLDPRIKKDLRKALGPVFEAAESGRPTWHTLEKVPLLAAVIKEGLRYVHISPSTSQKPATLLHLFQSHASRRTLLKADTLNQNVHRRYEPHPSRLA